MLSMKKIRNLVQRYERWVMLGLVMVVLVIFTVTGEMVDLMRPKPPDARDPADVAGSFAVLPGERTQISYEAYDAARRDYERATHVLTGGRGEGARPTDVWTHLVLLAAARREGVTVSNDELAAFLGNALPMEIFQDRARYKQFVRDRYNNISPQGFEEGIRDFLTTLRLREVYRQSFDVAPPATREEIIKQYTGQPLEFARVSWMALDAARFLEAAALEFDAEGDKDAVLRDFFEKDPAVQAAPTKFRHDKRYRFEILYTIHAKLTPENLERIETVFSKTWPELDMTRLEPKISDMREFYGRYSDRLIRQAGSTWEALRETGDEVPGDGLEGEEKPAGEEAPETEPTEAERQAMFNRGFNLVKEVVSRELRVKGIYQFLRDTAAKDDAASLREIFDLLAANDDPEDPVCSTEVGKGLIVLLDRSADPMSGEEIEDVEDDGVRFTHNVRFRITGQSDAELPKVGPVADILGEEGDGRMVYRVVGVEPERRKTFDELSAAEKDDLRDTFYLPENARQRAKEVLDALRTRMLEGELDLAELRKIGASCGARVQENEWITATDRFVAEPEPALYWKDAYLHMRDRYYLRRRLDQALRADRVKEEIKPGTLLEPSVDSRTDASDPGAAYLVLVLERRSPSAETMPLDDFETYVSIARRQRDARERERWSRNFVRLKQDFAMEFDKAMQEAVEDDLRKQEEAERKSALRQ